MKLTKKDSKKKDKDAAPEGEEGQEGVSLEELKGQLNDMKDGMHKEMEERNYFQLERDKINTFWEITKKELEEKKAELRNKDREMEEMEERHQVEIKVYKQKVKHLLYEHQNSITQLKTDLEMATKLLQDEHRYDCYPSLRKTLQHLCRLFYQIVNFGKRLNVASVVWPPMT